MHSPETKISVGNHWHRAIHSFCHLQRPHQPFPRSCHDMILKKSTSFVPFNWEEKPGIPKSRPTSNGENNNDSDDGDGDGDGVGEDFEFNFSGQLEQTSLSADELFDGDGVERGKKKKKKKEGCGKKKGERNEKEKGGERKYSCLINEEGIVIVKFEVLLFIMLTFLLK
jgi:hypothetical protein